MSEKILSPGKLRVYGRRCPDLPLYYTGGEISIATEIELGDETYAIFGGEKVVVRELLRKGEPSGLFILKSEMNACEDQSEVRHTRRGRLTTTASH